MSYYLKNYFELTDKARHKKIPSHFLGRDRILIFLFFKTNLSCRPDRFDKILRLIWSNK